MPPRLRHKLEAVEPVQRRAIRRHHRGRLLRRWSGIVRATFLFQDPYNIAREVRSRVKTRKPCSCAMCSGYRRWMAGPTRKELLNCLDYQEQLVDISTLANEGYSEWLALLPNDDDWGESFARATPIHWDEDTHEWVEDET